MPSKGVRKSKIPLNVNREVCFNSKNNANTFCRFLSNLADSLLQKLSHPDLLTKFINQNLLTKFGIKTTEEYYTQIRNECEDFVLRNVDVTAVDKMLKRDLCQIS